MGGGSPPPPPPPARQPYNANKETSMYYRNVAFSNAVRAAVDSYTAAIVVKTLADILVPVTDRQLREMIDFHFNVVAEYRRAQIIYIATVETFYEVDTLVKASVDKLKMIQNVGETYLDEYDKTTLKFIVDQITEIYNKQNTLQTLAVEGNTQLEIIKNLFNGSATSKTIQEINAEYDTLVDSIRSKCNQSNTILADVKDKVAVMKEKIDNDDLLKLVAQSKGTMAQALIASKENLQDSNRQIQQRMGENIEGLMKELENRNKWYAFYKKQADEVENRNLIAIRPEMFIRLLNWAKHSHLMSIYSALHALSASNYAFQDRNWP
jgi:hypothetical protein